MGELFKNDLKNEPRMVLGVYDPRVRRFVREVGPQIYTDLANDGIRNVALVSVGTGGQLFTIALEGYLIGQEINQKPILVEPVRLRRVQNKIYAHSVEGKRVIFGDDGINTGATYRLLKQRWGELKDKGAIDIKYAVYIDVLGLADYSCKSSPEGVDKLLALLDHSVNWTSSFLRRARNGNDKDASSGNATASVVTPNRDDNATVGRPAA